ncbi:hypothetical protein BT67DRAFT_263173 [Trichocladium antarcticum]|uniref:F-box domain-containing protein n=1 Tax=Trichocladium antarcticum TaxID=1450529 RepID=A0AAN6ZFS2_9PEZI|nr:hypothetical protein BT67DRAFT_263173 [Trichocladium antarcticum]
MSATTAACAILALPGEILNQIMAELNPLDLALLGSTCTHFRSIIPPFNINELVKVESTKIGVQRKLYACSFCLRLRHASRFADPMMRRKRRKHRGEERASRFCVECGLKQPTDERGYRPGNIVTMNGVAHVVCISCHRFECPADTRGDSRWCAKCWHKSPEGLWAQRLKEHRAEEERSRRRRKAEAEAEAGEQRPGKRKATWGADAEDTD